jgi:hypothetical protein
MATHQNHHSDQAKEAAQKQRTARPEVQGPAALAEQAAPLVLQRAVADPRVASPRDILALQRAYGNRAVTHLIQTKLMVGPAGDKYEREADRVAEQVLTMPAPAGNQQSAVGGQPPVQRQAEEEVQTKPLAASITPLVQRQAEEEEEVQTTPLLQRQAEEEEGVQTKPLLNPEGGFAASPGLERRLAAHKGSGSPLPEEVRADMETRLGADFSGVRVHTGGEAVQMSQELSAQSFTHGQDIYFGAGKYDPGSDTGKRLLAHELTHVVQQAGGQTIQRELIPESQRAFTTAQVGELFDPASGETGPGYGALKNTTDQYVPTSEQSEIIKLRSTLESWKGKSPEPEKKLKDLIRAFLLAMYAKRLWQLPSKYPNEKEQKEKKEEYFARNKQTRDMYAGLLEKGVAAPETQAFLRSQKFETVIPVTPEQAQAERAKGPRIDVRSTFIRGIRLRAHLFIVYTASDGSQIYFRGGPGSADENALTVADMGPYAPGETSDYDPSAPSVTVLSGEAAKAKLDALIEATSVISGMQVPYRAGGIFEEGENCNATAWTILTRAGVPTNKPAGIHPGWGHILGAKTKGKERALPKPEEITTTGQPRVVAGPPTVSIDVFADRKFFERAAQLPGGAPVELLAEVGAGARIKYHGNKIGFIADKFALTLPVWAAGAKKRGPPAKLRVGGKEETFKEHAARVLGISATELGKYQPNEVRAIYAFKDYHNRGHELDAATVLALLRDAKAGLEVLYIAKKLLRTWLGLDKEAWGKLVEATEELEMRPLVEAFQKLPEITTPADMYLPVYENPKGMSKGNLRPESKIRPTGVKKDGWVEVKLGPAQTMWLDAESFARLEKAIAEQGTKK